MRRTAVAIVCLSLATLGCPAGDDAPADAGTSTLETGSESTADDPSDDTATDESTSDDSSDSSSDDIDGSESTADDTSDSSTADDTSDSSTETGEPVRGCTAIGLELIELTNAYRMQNGLPAIPASPSLCTVATAHVHDTVDNNPAVGDCNLHSWSDQGPWTACCYTPDHAQAECMWAKPSELTSYPGNGYENSAGGVDTAAAALSGWQNSPAHNDVILEQGIWSEPWGAIGADVYGGYAHLWFGHEPDPAR